MYAIVTAGGIPNPEDPLYTFLKGDAKALVDVAGKPMIQWVLDALNAAQQVDAIILIGLSAKSGLTSKKPIHYISNQGRMLSNIVAGVHKALELNRKTEYVLVVSSDIPTLKGEMVDWLVSTCMETRDDLYYGVCPRDVMEARFPDSKRTYTRLKDMDLCGADIHVTHIRMATEHLDLWEKLIGNRKSPLRQASIVGLDTFWKIFTRSITFEDLVEHLSNRLGIKGRGIIWDRAEPCMDVDKPIQLELLRADLGGKKAKAKKAAQVKKAPAKKAPAKKASATSSSKGKKAAAKPASKAKTAKRKPAKKTAARKKAK
ncbi:MAG: nucleotidyltransferase family protein [Chloroflexi bacterium]|nr:nucleotidyltransferase family protein [Chloroflexota bacterium]